MAKKGRLDWSTKKRQKKGTVAKVDNSTDIVKKERKKKSSPRNRVKVKHDVLRATIEDIEGPGQGLEEPTRTVRVTRRTRSGKQKIQDVEQILVEKSNIPKAGTALKKEKKKRGRKPAAEKTKKSTLKVDSLVHVPSCDPPPVTDVGLEEHVESKSKPKIKEEKVKVSRQSKSSGNKSSVVVHQPIKTEDDDVSEKMLNYLMSTNPVPIEDFERIRDQNSEVALMPAFATRFVNPSKELIERAVDNPVSHLLRSALVEKTQMYEHGMHLQYVVDKLLAENCILKGFVSTSTESDLQKDHLLQELRLDHARVLNLLLDERKRFCIDWRNRDAERLVDETKRSAEEQNFYLQEQVHSTIDNLKMQYESQLKELDEDRKKLAAENDSIHKRNERQKRVLRDAQKQNNAYFKQTKLSCKYFSIMQWMVNSLARDLKKLDNTVRTGFEFQLSDFSGFLRDSLVEAGCCKTDFALTSADEEGLKRVFERMKSKVERKIKPADIKRYIANVGNQTHHDYLSDSEFEDVKPRLVYMKQEPICPNETPETGFESKDYININSKDELSHKTSLEAKSCPKTDESRDVPVGDSNCARSQLDQSRDIEMPADNSPISLQEQSRDMDMPADELNCAISHQDQSRDIETPAGDPPKLQQDQSRDIEMLADDSNLTKSQQEGGSEISKNGTQGRCNEIEDIKTTDKFIDDVDEINLMQDDFDFGLNDDIMFMEDDYISSVNDVQNNSCEEHDINVKSSSSTGTQEVQEFRKKNDVLDELGGNIGMEVRRDESKVSASMEDNKADCMKEIQDVSCTVNATSDQSIRVKDESTCIIKPSDQCIMSIKHEKSRNGETDAKNESVFLAPNMPDLCAVQASENALQTDPSRLDVGTFNPEIEVYNGKEVKYTPEAPVKLVSESGSKCIKDESQVKTNVALEPTLNPDVGSEVASVDPTSDSTLLEDLDLSESEPEPDDNSDTYISLSNETETSDEHDREQIVQQAQSLHSIPKTKETPQPVDSIINSTPTLAPTTKEPSERKLTILSHFRTRSSNSSVSTRTPDTQSIGKQNVNLHQERAAISKRHFIPERSCLPRDESSRSAVKTRNGKSKLPTAQVPTSSVKSRIMSTCGMIVPVNQTSNMCQKKRFEESMKSISEKRLAEKAKDKSLRPVQANSSARLSPKQEQGSSVNLSSSDSGDEPASKMPVLQKAIVTSGDDSSTSGYRKRKVAMTETAPYNSSSTVSKVSRKTCESPKLPTSKEAKSFRQLIKLTGRRGGGGKRTKPSQSRNQDKVGASASAKTKDIREVLSIPGGVKSDLGKAKCAAISQGSSDYKSRSSFTLSSQKMPKNKKDRADTKHGFTLPSSAPAGTSSMPKQVNHTVVGEGQVNPCPGTHNSVAGPNTQNQPTQLPHLNDQPGANQLNPFCNSLAFPNMQNQPAQFNSDFIQLVTMHVMNAMLNYAGANQVRVPSIPVTTATSDMTDIVAAAVSNSVTNVPINSECPASGNLELDQMKDYDSPASPAPNLDCSEDDEQSTRLFHDDEWKFVRSRESSTVRAWCARYLSAVFAESSDSSYGKFEKISAAFSKQLHTMDRKFSSYIYVGLASHIYDLILSSEPADLHDSDSPLKSDYIKMGTIIQKISRTSFGTFDFSKLPELLFEYFGTQILPNRSIAFANDDISFNKLGRFYSYLGKEFHLENLAVDLLLQAVYYRPPQAFSLAVAMFKIHIPFNTMSEFDSLPLKLRCILYCLLAPQRFHDSIGFHKLRGLMSSVRFKVSSQPYKQFIEGVISELKNLESSAALKEGCKCLGALLLQQNPELNVQLVGDMMAAVCLDWSRQLINDGVFAHVITSTGRVFLDSPDVISKGCLQQVQCIFESVRNGTGNSKFINDAVKAALKSISLRAARPAEEDFEMKYVRRYHATKEVKPKPKQKRFKKKRKTRNTRVGSSSSAGKED